VSVKETRADSSQLWRCGLTTDTMFHPKMKNADLFAMLSQATEVSR
jgi:hypothetical protein